MTCYRVRILLYMYNEHIVLLIPLDLHQHVFSDVLVYANAVNVLSICILSGKEIL